MKSISDYTLVTWTSIIFLIFSSLFFSIFLNEIYFNNIVNGSLYHIALGISAIVFWIILPILFGSYMLRKFIIKGNSITIISFFGFKKKTYTIDEKKYIVKNYHNKIQKKLPVNERYYNSRILFIKTKEGRSIKIPENQYKNFNEILRFVKKASHKI
ncbi:MAG: hypothetical protein RLZZ577_1268 [Bacteroidota bacterium]|jgi:hypothetical protein